MVACTAWLAAPVLTAFRLFVPTQARSGLDVTTMPPTESQEFATVSALGLSNQFLAGRRTEPPAKNAGTTSPLVPALAVIAVIVAANVAIALNVLASAWAVAVAVVAMRVAGVP